MIDIIIPLYNDRKSLPYVLMSIALQRVSCDFLVTIVDDASSEKYTDIIMKFKNIIPIKYMKLKKNSGAGVARQFGIDNTESDYIVFLDSDDLFYSVDSLSKLFQSIEKGYDEVSGMEYDEYRNASFFNEGNLHGKIYRRSFLSYNNVKFNNTRFHEDNYFNNLALLCDGKFLELEEIIYIYCNNEDSTTNKYNSSEFERLPILLANVREILKLNPLNSNNVDKLVHFVYMKYRFYNRIFRTFNKKEKNQFKKWLKYYDSNNCKFLEIYDYNDLYNLINEYYYKLLETQDN